MAYSPATKLYYSDSDSHHIATVLSDGMVRCTAGLYKGEQMKLIDWLILAEGRELVHTGSVYADNIWEHARLKSGHSTLEEVNLDRANIIPEDRAKKNLEHAARLWNQEPEDEYSRHY